MIIAVAIALIIRTFIIEAYKIPSQAMQPTLLAGDALFVGKWFAWLHSEDFPKRGDVIVFSGEPEPSRGSSDFVKRVLALPGDRISIEKGKITLNGKKLESIQTRIPHQLTEILPEGRSYQVYKDPSFMDDYGPEKIASGFLFVIGDYRTTLLNNKKRKPWSIVPFESLKGKALWTWISIEPNRMIPHPAGKGEDAPTWLNRLRLDRIFRRIE